MGSEMCIRDRYYKGSVLLMKTREEALKFGLSFKNVYEERPFKDQNWQLVRVKGSKKAFLWIYERDGYINLNVKVNPEWRDFWRSAYDAVIAGYHQNKEYWNTIILDGSIPDKDIKRMIAESYDIITNSPTKRIYEAVKRIPKGHVATYGKVAEMAGNAKMSRAVGNALHNIEISIHNLEEAVDKVGTASGEIVDIIKLIGDIAEETNLLSLNASIEAARAGEAGRGFAVVASQIGVLAKNSADSVAHITSLINEINGLVDDAVKQAGSSASDIESSADLIHIAVDTFDQIFQNIQETSHLIEGVVEKINQVDQVATNVAAISEEQAASSDEILATSESMLQQAKSISKNSEQVEAEAGNLAESADQLADQVKQFQI